MSANSRIQDAARRRFRRNRADRVRVLRLLLQRHPLEAERDRRRVIRVIERRARVDRKTASAIAAGKPPQSLGLSAEQRLVAMAVQGGTIDFLPIAFVERARTAANAVGRLVVKGGSAGAGTCFMISPRLLITNHHVIGRPEIALQREVEFNLELGTNAKARPVSRFRLDPAAFFLTDDHDDLDYTVVALGTPVNGSGGAIGSRPLSEANNKHLIGDFVNIIQHPEDGGDPFKKVVVRENRVVSRIGNVLHYTADTLGGSSGSPVFNDDWEVVALHHQAGVDKNTLKLAAGLEIPDEVNEGIRASALVRELKARRSSLTPQQRQMLDEAVA